MQQNSRLNYHIIVTEYLIYVNSLCLDAPVYLQCLLAYVIYSVNEERMNKGNETKWKANCCSSARRIVWLLKRMRPSNRSFRGSFVIFDMLLTDFRVYVHLDHCIYLFIYSIFRTSFLRAYTHQRYMVPLVFPCMVLLPVLLLQSKKYTVS